ncbi:MAG: glycosyltransferase [Desulfovibrio sp.]|jgi:glycosyltransferase involved in cell wall biosynthesis|nr:glycosyltransferase [Desulfovibrio sp.]
MQKIRLTVIICTYNRAYILGECLQSLVDQTASHDSFEVIVIDNNSTDDTREVAESFRGNFPNLHVVFEPEQGLSHARNRALVEAETEWIAFLDDDAKAYPNWVETILATIEKDDFDLFGGPYLAWHRFGPPPKWFSSEWETTISIQNYYGLLPVNNYPTGGNCVFKKSLIAGRFPTHIGMVGNKCAYGEETLLFIRMREQGARLGWVPDMLVDHCVLPYKYSLRWRCLSAFANGRDASLVFEQSFCVRSLAGACRLLVKAMAWGLPKQCYWGYRQQFHWQRIFLDAVTPVLSEAGRLFTLLRGTITCLTKMKSFQR